MADEAEVEEALLEVLKETDLLKFRTKLIFDKQLTRIEHFPDVTDQELKSYGLSEPAIRRLRSAIERRRKKRAKLFGGNKREKMIKIRKEVAVESNGLEFANSQPHLIPQNEIKLMENLGEGNFSIVKRALWTRSDGSKVDCAVKILHNMSETIRQDLAVEVSNMQRLRHQNLVQLFGVVFDERILMVIEFCEGGSLLNRLRDQSKPRPLVTTLLNYSQQIANGMGYLESRKCVHRDLAARNILLTHEDQVIKICDFGLTRALSENERLYVMSEAKKVPFSWCPPESLRYRQFSHKSDVWAFGVTMWELYSFGEEPWIGCRAAEVLQLTESGQRLHKPDQCPNEVYEIMNMCWRHDPEERPKFSHLRKLIIDVKFMTMVCRQLNAATAPGALQLSPGDEVVLVGEKGDANWYGQSARTRQFGEFPRSCVAVKSLPQPTNGPSAVQTNHFQHRSDISFPIAGSFIHTGHGDLDERRCWGHVTHIDDVYLKNPLVVPNPMQALDQKITFVPSILTLQRTTDNPVEATSPDAQNTAECFMPSSSSRSSHPLPLPSLNRLGDGNSTTSSRSSNATIPSLNELQRQNEAFEWISTEISQLSASGSKRNSPNTTTESRTAPVLPPPQSQARPPLNGGMGQATTAIANSKYDSAISIPRPNRSSPVNRSDLRLTPPIISAEKYAPAASSVPSTSATTHSEMDLKTALEREEKRMQRRICRPSAAAGCDRSSYNAVDRIGDSSTDDPFVVKEDVKTLTNKVRYNDVHNFLALERQPRVSTAPSTSSSANNKPWAPDQLQQQQGNVAVVFPFVNENASFASTSTPKTNLLETAAKATINNTSPYSMLPPPSELLLSGFESSSIADKSTSKFSHYQPIFDISGRANNTPAQDPNRSRIRYGSNGIPILEPVPVTPQLTTNRIESGQNAEERKRLTVTLSDLDTDAMLGRVRSSVDFASADQCRQALWRNGFDEEKTVRELKIDKLLEMGLATDKDLAASALDSEKWDVNAAANRLCCP